MKPARTKRTWLWLLLLVVCVISGLWWNAISEREAAAQDPFNLEWAIRTEDIEQVEQLIDDGADLEARYLSRQKQGWTPLMLAVFTSNRSPVASSRPAPLTYWNRDRPDQHEKDQLAIVKLLLNKGADLEAEDDKGWTSLIHALLGEQIHSQEIVQLLLNNGSDLDAKDYLGRTPLIHAARAHHSNSGDFVQILLNHGADPLAKDCIGKMASDYSQKNENLKGTEVHQRLLEMSGR